MRPAAPASESGPAALRRARPRPRQDPRVHLRRRDRPDRGGPPARPRRARPAAARRALGGARRGPRAGPRPRRAPPPRAGRRARPPLRLAGGAGALPAERAGRERQGGAGAWPPVGAVFAPANGWLGGEVVIPGARGRDDRFPWVAV